jgi:MFS family permease
MESTPGSDSKSSNRWNALAFAARINLYAIALSALWTPLNSILLPDLVGESAPPGLRGSALGLITFIGIGAAVFVQPVAGAISDASSRLRDRRKPFILPSSGVMVGALLLLAILPGFWWLLLTYVLLQLVGNIAQAAFQALVPDLVPEEEIGEASGVKSGFGLLGTLIGLSLVGLLVMVGWGDREVVWVLAAFVALGAFAVWKLVPAGSSGGNAPGESGLQLVKAAYAPLIHGPRDFKFVLLTRFLFLLGLYPVQRFLLYFLEDRFGVEDPVTQASVAILGAVAIGAVASVVAGAISDRVGRKPVLAASIVCAGLGVLGVAIMPTLILVAAAGLLVAIGAGAFEGVNWATIADNIPEGEGARYFGVANMTTAGASAAVGLLGPVVDLLDRLVPAATYPSTFAVAGICVLTALIPVRAGRIRSGPQEAPAEA